jgi:ribosomal protein L30
MAKLRITYSKSGIGYSRDQKDTIRSLGLRKLNSTVIQDDTPTIRGMVFKVRHLVRVEELADDAAGEQKAPAARRRTPTTLARQGASAVGAEPDDLERIEGIGPKIAGVLQAAGITTFAQLAAADTDRLGAILSEAKLNLASAETWPEQAALAAAGKWDEFERLTESLKGGRRS